MAVQNVVVHSMSMDTNILSFSVNFQHIVSGSPLVNTRLLVIPWATVTSAQGLADMINAENPHPQIKTTGTLDVTTVIKATTCGSGLVMFDYIHPTLDRDTFVTIVPRNPFTREVMGIPPPDSFSYFTTAKRTRTLSFDISEFLDPLSHIRLSMPGFVDDAHGLRPYLITFPASKTGNVHKLRVSNLDFIPVVNGSFGEVPLQFDLVTESGRTDKYSVYDSELTVIYERILRDGVPPHTIRPWHTYV
jgi:hypothetical protein